MRSSNYPFLADLIAISTRWLVLLGLMAALGMSGGVTLALALALGLMSAWNFFMSILSLANRRLVGHRFINISVDVVGTLGLFVLSGGMKGPVVWAGVLALFSASLYYEVKGGALIGLLITLLEVGWLALSRPAWGPLWLPLTLLAVMNIGAGLVLGFVGKRLVRRLRGLYQKEMNQRKEAELKARQQERSRMRAMYQMTETLSKSLNYQVVLDTALDLSATLMADDPQHPRLLSAVLLFQGAALKVGSARRLGAADLQRSLPAKSGALAEAIRSGSPQHVSAPARDSELGTLMGLQDCNAALCLPLMRGMTAYGVLLYAHTDADFFSTERSEMLEMVGHQAVIAIQNASLYQDLEREKENLVESQEEARKKLARDLHDGPTQSVASIAMRLSIARRLLEQDPAAAADELQKLEDLARRTTKEVRHMLFTLRPLALESDGLAVALQVMAEKMQEVYQQNVSVTVDEAAINELDIPKQSVVFYIAEEAVNNARKHARADEVKISLQYVPRDREFIALEIADNGVGFDVQAVNETYERRGSLGMVNLRERAELVNGYLNIHSAPGHGTRVRVIIPINDAAADRLQRGLVKPAG